MWCVCVCVCVCVCECLVLHCLLRDCSLSDSYVKAISARRKRVVVRCVGQADLNSLLEMATGFMSYTQLCCIARLGCNGPPGFCYLYPSRCLPLHPSGVGGSFNTSPVNQRTQPLYLLGSERQLPVVGADPTVNTAAAAELPHVHSEGAGCAVPGVGCYRVLWRGVLPGPWRGVLPGPLAWGATGFFGVGRYQVPGVGCYRVLWRGVLPGPWRGVVPGPLAWGGTRFLAWGATGSFGVGWYQVPRVGWYRVRWRGVVPGPLVWGNTGSLGVGCYRVLWLGVVPGPLAWGASGSLGVGCYRLILRGVVPGPLAWGATGSLGVGCYRLTLGGVVPAHFARCGTRSLGLVHLRVGAGGRHSVPTSRLEVSPPC